MRRFSGVLTRQKTKGDSVKNEEAMSEERSSLMYGVSLAHLISLPVSYKKGFTAACKYVKKKTKRMQGYRSYARWLKNNPKTKHLVRDQATVFVSYAWSGGFGKTMDALKEHFKDKLDETFVWMDFAIVDQHKAATTNIDFHEWAKTFRESLMKIGQAVLVLTPGQKPIAISRSWCCFEWTTIVQSEIPFSYCVPVEDEKKLIGRMHKGMGFADINTLFAGINVEKAEAFKASDQKAILELMREVGIIAVNDIVMKSLKKWLLKVTVKAEESASESTTQMQWALNAKASLHHALGELDDALPYYEKAFTCAKCVPNNDIHVATSLNNLAELLKAIGDYEAAEPLYSEALAIKKKALGDNHPDVATSLNNLALLLDSKGDYQAAESLYREALAIRKKALGDNHPDVAQSLNNLAVLLSAKGDYEAAEPLHREALAIWKKALGDNHPSVATSLGNLAGLLDSKGDYEAAEPLHREALAIRKKALGDNHPLVATSLNNLALLLDSKGDYQAAESLYREALAIRKKALGDNHPDVAQSLNNLGGLLITQGEKAEARRLIEQALNIRINFFGNKHPDVANSLWGLATIEEEAKDALRLGKQALDVSEKALGLNHPTTQKIRSFIESII